MFSLLRSATGIRQERDKPRHSIRPVHHDGRPRTAIVGYLSKPQKDTAGKRLPVVLFVQGSGSQSLWVKNGDRIGGGLQNLVLRLAKDRARVVVVEKPGVQFLDCPKQPGTAIEGSREFLVEHTLPRGAEANAAALKAVLSQPEIDSSRVLVMGHSEGGIVAARIAAEMPAVTHAAPLGCGGVTQLYSLAELARRSAPPGQAVAAMQSVYDEWAKIQARPDSIEDFWMGHPYRRWSTFLRNSVVAKLKKSHAKIYLCTAPPTKPTLFRPLTSCVLSFWRRAEPSRQSASKAATTASAPPDQRDSQTR